MLLLTLCLSPVAQSSADAEVVRGEVVRVSTPYLLIKTSSGHEVVKVTYAATLGNLASLSELKHGGIAVECSGEPAANRITNAFSVLKAPQFKAMPNIEIPPEQAATWRDLPAGPERHQIVDVRSKGEWEEGHIQGAISVPFNAGFSRALPADKSLGLVFYAANSFSDLPHKAARAAVSGGYAKVRVYSGGLADWRKKGYATAITAAGAARIMARNEPLLVLDIRSAADWKQGHVSGAISAPPGTFSPGMIQPKGRNYFLPLLIAGYDDSDGLQFLREPSLSSYHNNGPVAFLEGGMAAWRSSGLPVIKTADSPPLTSLLPKDEIGFDEFSALWKQRGEAPATLLNIRDEDLNQPGVVNLPFAKLGDRLQELPRDKELIIFCYTGIKAVIAHHLLKNNGFKTRFLNRNVGFTEDGELLE